MCLYLLANVVSNLVENHHLRDFHSSKTFPWIHFLSSTNGNSFPEARFVHLFNSDELRCDSIANILSRYIDNHDPKVSILGGGGASLPTNV